MLVASYFGVCIMGWALVATCLYGMRWVVLKERPPFSEWSVFFIGVTERAVALTLVLMAPPYLPVFIGGWVVLKFALGWQREKDKNAAAGSMLALIGNVLSFAVAVAVGAALNPQALVVWATPR